MYIIVPHVNAIDITRDDKHHMYINNYMLVQ